MHLDEKLDCYVEYLHRDDAIEKMRCWSEELLKDADRHLFSGASRSNLERAVDSSERARIVSPTPELRGLYEKSLKLFGAAWIALDDGDGDHDDDLRWILQADGDPALSHAVMMAAREHATRLKRTGPYLQKCLKEKQAAITMGSTSVQPHRLAA